MTTVAYAVVNPACSRVVTVRDTRAGALAAAHLVGTAVNRGVYRICRITVRTVDPAPFRHPAVGGGCCDKRKR